MRAGWACLCCLLFCAAAADARQVRVVRTGDARLAGIEAVDVVVTRDDAARDGPCAIGIQGVQQAAVTALRAASLTATVSEKAPSWFHSVVFAIGVLRVGDACAASIASEIITPVEAIPDADRHLPRDVWGSLLIGDMALVRHHTLVQAAPAGLASAVEHSVAAHAAAYAERIIAARR